MAVFLQTLVEDGPHSSNLKGFSGALKRYMLLNVQAQGGLNSVDSDSPGHTRTKKYCTVATNTKVFKAVCCTQELRDAT